MATVNRFYQPHDYEYVSQYAPIPFDLLFQLGRYYQQQLEKAMDNLSKAILDWKTFLSPSEVDMENWNKLTIEPAKELALKFALNPDLIKTAAGRAELQTFINSRPYDQLARLQQGKQDLLRRQALEMKMMQNGTYYDPWHRFNYAGHNSLTENVNMNLTPYQDIRSIVEPYVNNLKPEMIGRTKDGMYDLKGVSKERIAQQLSLQFKDIINTPQGQEYLKQYQRAGATPKEAMQLLQDQLISKGTEFAWSLPEVNPFALASHKEQLIRDRRNRSGQLDTPLDGIRYTQIMDRIAMSKPITQQRALAAKRMIDSSGPVDWDSMTPEDFNTKLTEYMKAHPVTEKELYETAYKEGGKSQVYNQLFAPVQNSTYVQTLVESMPNTEVKDLGYGNKTTVINDLGSYVTANNLINSILEIPDNKEAALQQYLRNNKIDGEYYSTVGVGMAGGKNVHMFNTRVDLDDLIQFGKEMLPEYQKYTDAELKDRNGKSNKIFGSDKPGKKFENDLVKLLNDMGYQTISGNAYVSPVQNVRSGSSSSISGKANPKTYVIIPMATEFARDEDAMYSTPLNNMYNNANRKTKLIDSRFTLDFYNTLGDQE